MLYSKKNILTATAFIALVISITCFFNYLLVPYSTLAKKFDDFELNDRNINILVTGSSLEGAVNSKVISDYFDENAYVFSIQGGTLETSYYILLDALQENDIKTFICGFDFLQSFRIPPYKYPRYPEFHRFLMKHSKKSIHLKYLSLLGLSKERYTSGIFNFSSFSKNLQSPRKLKEVAESKRNSKVDRASQASVQTLQKDEEIPVDKNDLQNPLFRFKSATEQLYTSQIDINDLIYLRKISQICKTNNIDLYILVCPTPVCTRENIIMYDKMMNSTKKLFEENQVINGFEDPIFSELTDESFYSDCYGHILHRNSDFYTTLVCNSIKYFGRE